jgi:hypothetical protein
MVPVSKSKHAGDHATVLIMNRAHRKEPLGAKRWPPNRLVTGSLVVSALQRRQRRS